MFDIIFDRSIGLPSFSVNIENYHNVNLKQIIQNHMQLHFTEKPFIDFYILCNGKKVSDNECSSGLLHIVPCLPGGKGGFGSMLRAIGAQIEKTTNREACRDLSGRRLRDINEEKRLKKWIAEQAEREREAAEKKKKKLSKLCVEPKHEFSDPDYDKARTEMTDKVHDAVEEGLKSIKSSDEPSVSEHKSNKNKRKDKKIKGALWVDELEDLDEDDDSEESEEETPKKKIKVAD